MIKIVTGKNRGKVSEEINAMVADRKHVFVDILKWDLPVTDALYEVDQFDNDDAVYLLSVDDSGTHLGSMRLLRTDRPHVLGSLFPHLSEVGIPSGEDTLEITRLCLSPRLPARERRSPVYGNRAYAAFDRVGIELDPPVRQEVAEAIPTREGVTQNLGHGRSPVNSSQLGLEPGIERVDERSAALLTRGGARLRVLDADLVIGESR